MLEVALVALAAWLASGTLLSLTTNPHWYVRGWDFPRVVVLALAVLAAGVYGPLFFEGSVLDWAVMASMAAVAAWQTAKIIPYTRLVRPSVRSADPRAAEARIRLVISNVLMENTEHERWVSVVRGARPDVVVALEPDARWRAAMEPLRSELPHAAECVLSNYYGLVVLSRFELVDPQVRFLVDRETPSIHARVPLADGRPVWLHAIHPRPPEPVTGTDSEARDAELVLLAREIGKAADEPRIVAGDLNDVAWSYTTKLFLRLSGLLDPRRGRGLFATFNANHPRPLRWPLDHVFHSRHFTLAELRLLPHVGSDHLAVLIDLCLEPGALQVQEKPPAPSGADVENAREMLERQPPAERPPA
ncbi:MAG TPA: endonuclease/exonuclease/phosphatase family protein [Vicinamibacteria bacterium]|nr:endonuclease/exonuclease/phosphatase family protein [Vicinamibacteria bacterium]